MALGYTGLRDHYLGCVLGLAVGNALGAPFVRRGFYQIEAEHPKGVRAMCGGGIHKTTPGEWLATTAEALAVMESHLTSGGFDGLDLAFRLGALLRNHTKGLDPDSTRVLSDLEEDPERWPEAARIAWLESSGTTAGNGALGRGLAASLLALGDMDRLLRDTVATCQLTHYDPRCTEASAALAFILSQVLPGHFRPDLLRQTQGFLTNFRSLPLYRESVGNFDRQELLSHANETPFVAYGEDPDAIPVSLRKIMTMKREDLRESPYVVHTLEVALWCFMNARSFEEGVATAVGVGGETDEQGAVAGALLGARFGLAGIPATWLNALRERPLLIAVAERAMANCSLEV